MTAIDRDRARAAFKSYTDAYDATNPRIALKIEHTYHVAEACDAVAREQGWSSEDIDLAWLCGLLHDMGRFEQLRRWDTFKDAESMSHAALGIEVLFGENPADAPAVTSIRDFIDDPAEDELIRASIAYHSDFRLPSQLDERTRSFCDIVRDGDKIDIMRTIADSTVDTILKVDEDTFLASRFSTPALTAFDEHRCVARDERNELRTTWWGSSALCLSSSIRQAVRWRASKAISIACSTRPLALRGPLPTPPRRQPGAALRTSCAAGWQALSTRAEPATPQRPRRRFQQPCTGRRQRWGHPGPH